MHTTFLLSLVFFTLLLAAQAVVDTWIDNYYQCNTFSDHLRGVVASAMGGVLPGSIRGVVKVYYDCQIRQENAVHVKQWLKVSMWAPAVLMAHRLGLVPGGWGLKRGDARGGGHELQLARGPLEDAY